MAGAAAALSCPGFPPSLPLSFAVSSLKSLCPQRPELPRGISDTQGLKIVTAVHPIGPGICCLIYE